MKKFKVGDYVYFYDDQMSGEIVHDNNDGTYIVEFENGSMTVDRSDMKMGEKPDWRLLPEMSLQEFDEKSKVILEEMKQQNKSMSVVDIATVLLFSQMFKDKYMVNPYERH